MTNSHTNSWTLTITLIATALSASYSMKIILLTLTNYPRSKHNANKEPNSIMKPLTRLTVASILLGTLTKLSTLQNTTMSTMPEMIKLAALTSSLIGMTMSTDMMHINSLTSPKKPKTLAIFFNQMAFFNMPHRTITMSSTKTSQQISTELIDLWTMENWGPKGLSNLTIPMIYLSTQQKNMIKNYMTVFTTTVFITLLVLLT